MLRLAMIALLGGLLSVQPADARPRDERGNKSQAQEERAERRDRPEPQQDRRERHADEGAEAQRREPSGSQHQRRAAGAARHAQRLNGGGRVLSVSPEGQDYRVKLLKDGEVRTYVVPAE